MDTWIVFRIHHYWEIQEVVNGHKSAAHTDSPDGGTGKTCLGGGMHCPSLLVLNYNVGSLRLHMVVIIVISKTGYILCALH